MTQTTKEVTFYSKYANYAITVEKPSVQYDSHGRRVEVGGTVADFSPTGVLVTDDSTIIESLRESTLLKVDFWELGDEPDAMKPTQEEVLAAVVEAVGAQDVTKLNELLADEKATHNRALLVGTIEQSLVNVQAQVKAGAKPVVRASKPKKAPPKQAEVPEAEPADEDGDEKATEPSESPEEATSDGE